MIWLLVGYMILFIHRPFEIWPELAAIRLERMYMIVVLVCALFSGRFKLASHPINTSLFVLLFAVLTSWILSPWFAHETAQKVVLDWLKVVLFFVLVPSFCTTRRELDLLMTGFVLATGFYVAHSVFEYAMGRHQFSMGVRRLLGINQTLKHPNSFATVSILVMPVAYFVFRNAINGTAKLGAITYGFLAGIGAVLTSSRMGTIGLCFIGLMLIIRSKRRILWLTIVPIIGVVTWSVIPDNKKDRIMSIFDSSVGPKNARESAETRMESFWIGMELFQKYPATGTGPGAWRAASGSELVAHTIYGQAPGEVGIVGSAAFVLFVSTSLFTAYKMYTVRKRDNNLSEEDLQYYSSLGSTFLWVFCLMLLFGFSGGNLFRFYWIWNAGFLMVASLVLASESNNEWEDDDEDYPEDDGYASLQDFDYEDSGEFDFQSFDQPRIEHRQSD